MATTVYVPVEEYLSTVYEPDCDYVDGELRERNLGTRPHSILQSLLAQWFNDRFDQFGTVGMTEQRVQITETRFRIPDVCVALSGDNNGDIIEVAPLVCIEVLSPDDRLPDVQQKLNDYTRMRVQNIWVIDPVTRAVWIAQDAALRQVEDLEIVITGTSMKIDLAEVFSQFDRRLHPRPGR